MKIRLVLAIAIILFSITSGIEIFGMKEKSEGESSEEDKSSKENKKINEKEIKEKKINIPIINEKKNYNLKNPLTDSNIILDDDILRGNIDKEIFNKKKINSKFFIDKPFGEDKEVNNIVYYLYKKGGNIYISSFGFTVFEIFTSFGISILNNIFGFENMVRNKFYANILLLKFGFKLAIPFLSFIIVDFNICVYNWLSSYVKYIAIYPHKALLKKFEIEWEADCFKKNNLKFFIYLFNVFNIDIKLSIFKLSLCFPLTKILEALLIYKGMKEFYFEEKIEQKLVNYNDEIKKNDFYSSICSTVEKDHKKIKEDITYIDGKYKEMMKCIENTSKECKRKFIPNFLIM